ncbi:hypothetical protein P692DRAFT_20904372 [Suillus brevipes Sb2]|nr:hypothetical protein P692DRAFT_20904372 [Suillus brevipes Sb2]
MLPDVHPSVQPRVKCHKAFSMVCKTLILHLRNPVAVLLHPLGDCAHARSLLAFPNRSIVPNLMPMNQLNSGNAQDLALLLAVFLRLSKFLHWMTRRHYMLLGGQKRLVKRPSASKTPNGGFVSCCSSAACPRPPTATINGVGAWTSVFILYLPFATSLLSTISIIDA